MTQLALLVADDGTLVPSTQRDIAALRHMKARRGEVIYADFRLAPDAQALRKCHLLCHFAFENQERYGDYDDFREALTLETSFTKKFVTLGGHHRKEARSWSYGSMSGDEHRQLFLELVRVIHERIYPGLTETWLVESADQQAYLDAVAGLEFGPVGKFDEARDVLRAARKAA
jgi:hypothetical protein